MCSLILVWIYLKNWFEFVMNSDLARSECIIGRSDACQVWPITQNPFTWLKNSNYGLKGRHWSFDFFEYPYNEYIIWKFRVFSTIYFLGKSIPGHIPIYKTFQHMIKCQFNELPVVKYHSEFWCMSQIRDNLKIILFHLQFNCFPDFSKF